MPFSPGRSGNPVGRPKGAIGAKPRGTVARVTPEIRTLAGRLFDREYWLQKYDQLHSGKMHPRLEIVLLQYVYGAPGKEAQGTNTTVIQLGPLEALQQALEAAHRGETPEVISGERTLQAVARRDPEPSELDDEKVED